MRKKIGILSIVGLLLVSCTTGQGIPNNKKEFIWEWRSDTITLIITEEWKLNYKKDSNNSSTSFSWPIQEFTNEYIKAGIWFFSKEFTVDDFPHINAEWKTQVMINGETLFKTPLLWQLQAPHDEKIDDLTIMSFGLFLESIKEWNFVDFYESTSYTFKQEYSYEDFTEIFSDFLWMHEEAERLWWGNFILSKKPYVDQNDILQISWTLFSPNEDNWELHFELGYTYEHPEWMLSKMNFELY